MYYINTMPPLYCLIDNASRNQEINKSEIYVTVTFIVGAKTVKQTRIGGKTVAGRIE